MPGIRPQPRSVWPLLIAILSLATLIGACSVTPSGSAPAQPGQPAAPEPKRVGIFSSIAGTSYLRAPILEMRPSSSGFSLSSPSYTPDRAHNYVYLDMQTAQTLMLLPSNDAFILETSALPERPQGEVEQWQIAWFLYRIVKSDTNGDGELTEADTNMLAISDAGGQNYAELIDGIEVIYGQAMPDPQTTLIIYRKAGALWLSYIDLPQHAVTQTVELPSFGPDVQL